MWWIRVVKYKGFYIISYKTDCWKVGKWDERQQWQAEFVFSQETTAIEVLNTAVESRSQSAFVV